MDPRQESPKTTSISPIDCFVFINSFTAAQRVSFVGTAEKEDVRRLYGSGFALTLSAERRMAQEMGGRGVVGLPSSNRMHDILSGDDMKIGFEDILSLPENRPLFVKQQEDPHAAMESKP
jgi:hypothetical protein